MLLSMSDNRDRFDDPGTQTATLEDFIPADAQPDEVSSQTNN